MMCFVYTRLPSGDQKVQTVEEKPLRLMSSKVSCDPPCFQEQEEAIEEREEQEKKEEETHYWERVLGDSYALHLGQLQREQEEIAKSLGKGKRIRKQINYAETMQDGMLKVGGIKTRE